MHIFYLSAKKKGSLEKLNVLIIFNDIIYILNKEKNTSINFFNQKVKNMRFKSIFYLFC